MRTIHLNITKLNKSYMERWTIKDDGIVKSYYSKIIPRKMTNWEELGVEVFE